MYGSEPLGVLLSIPIQSERMLLTYLHSVSLWALFLTGLLLVYECSMWYVQGGTWIGTAALALVGGSCLCLVLFGQRNHSEGVVAATIISAFWTVGAAIAFAKEQAMVPAWTLVASAIAQVTSSVAGAAISKRKRSNGSGFTDDEDFLNSPAASQTGRRNYGALSSFVDPLSAGSRIGPSASQGSLASMHSSASHQQAAAVHSPTTSPLGRTPSPFGSHNSPHRLAPASLASLSAAAATPKETPEDIKQSYKALWEKYDLDT